MKIKILALFSCLTLLLPHSFAKDEFEIVFTSQEEGFVSKVWKSIENKAKVANYKLRPCGWKPALFIDTYYDNEALDFYHASSALRYRERYKTLDQSNLRDSFYEFKMNQSSSEGFLNKEIKGESNEDGNLAKEMRVKDSIDLGQDNEAISAIKSSFPEMEEIIPMMRVKNKRYFACAYKGLGIIPDFALTLDNINLKNLKGDEVIEYGEIEIQIFNQIPAINRVNKKSKARIKEFADEFAKEYQLSPSSFSKYKFGVESFFLSR